DEKTLGIDIETKDTDLTTRGPGFLRGDAQVVGISLATLDKSWYFPIRHLGGGCLDPENTIRYLRDLSRQDRVYVGANLQYELEGLSSEGVDLHGKFIDVQVAEALIDEEQETYQLEFLCKKYLGTGKDESLLREAASAYGVDPKAGLWKLHSKYVGPYAEYDVQAPLLIFREQLKVLEVEELTRVFQLECELLPLLWEMRKQGIPVDMWAADALSEKLRVEESKLRERMIHEFGTTCNEMSGSEISTICSRLGILFPRTVAGNPSFTADYLDEADHPFLMLINDLRECCGMRNKFVQGWLHKNQIRGRIHPSWRQVARDDGGTRTGRMAAANPNPQQIPAGKYRKSGKPNPIGCAIRECFVSDTGNWGKLDYSQQEPRILVHFSALCDHTGARIARMAYQKDRKMDFYNFMVEAAGIDRCPAKDMYLGRCYGMGVKKMARKLNRTEEEAKQILSVFDEKVPFVKEIADSCMRLADKRGYIKTLLGRRRHFNLWEPAEYGRMKYGERPLPLKEAEAMWGPNLRRSNTHKALNALIQGSAADMAKAAMLKIWREGGVIPYLTMHDETDFPARDMAHAELCQQLAESAVEMTVPMVADLSYGRTWK
ncbi:hypothetical protein EPO05_06470, partial [Patescibacteria group bacterium]